MISSVIHAGGKGTRLREAYDGPKALAPVDGFPLLWYHLQPLIESRLVSNFVFTLMNDREKIIDYMDSYAEDERIQVSYVIEPRPLGRAGSIRYGMEEGLIEEDIPCLMSHPDDLVPVRIKELMDYADDVVTKGKSVILVMAQKTVNPFGIGVTEESNDIIELKYFIEKPELSLIPNHYANTGMALYMPEALKEFKKVSMERKTHPEEELLPRLVKQKKVSVFLVERWLSVNYSSEYDAAEKMGKSGLLEYLRLS